ncbi:SDR family oxidoreductase [Enterococcus termitis]|uniref:Oxidoreductase n=1 Tax=Enterococcus termitis TaxID=332950 RepID=A0A1E5GVM4_9ENTE|nr:SDR family oxidoreductase [Enterococcus termitis]OEG16697.1 oxidoreductase [Enterococcus termitis]OJG99393.1 oxidoreductase, short-chain dehydrogenase/reductase family [Enterococcus termitis]
MKKPLVIITGASSGFGAEMAKQFNADNYPLLLLGRRVEKINALPLNFDQVLVKAVDVTNLEQFQAAVAEGEKAFGKADLLINNAGVMLLGNVWKQDASEWQTMMDTNVIGVLNGMKTVMQSMMDRHHGTIINISSIAGRKTFGNHAAYAASKFGVHALSETVREELSSHNVRVLVMAPGAAETELLTHVTDQDAADTYESWKASMGGVTLDPIYVAKTVKYMYELPQEVSIREVLIAATSQDA